MGALFSNNIPYSITLYNRPTKLNVIPDCFSESTDIISLTVSVKTPTSYLFPDCFSENTDIVRGEPEEELGVG